MVHHLEGHCLVARLRAQRITIDHSSQDDAGIDALTNTARGALTTFTPHVDFPYLALVGINNNEQMRIYVDRYMTLFHLKGGRVPCFFL